MTRVRMMTVTERAIITTTNKDRTDVNYSNSTEDIQC